MGCADSLTRPPPRSRALTARLLTGAAGLGAVSAARGMARRQPDMAGEKAGEIGRVLETQGEGDFLDRHQREREVAGRLKHHPRIDDIERRSAERAPADPVEMGFRHRQPLGVVGDRPAGPKVAIDQRPELRGAPPDPPRQRVPRAQASPTRRGQQLSSTIDRCASINSSRPGAPPSYSRAAAATPRATISPAASSSPSGAMRGRSIAARSVGLASRMRSARSDEA